MADGDWPLTWDDLDATSRRAFIDACQKRWSEVRSELEPRELDDALEQCDETENALAGAALDGTECDLLRAVYVPD